PLHARPPLGRPGRRPAPSAPSRAAARGAAERARPAARLRLPPALSARRGHLPPPRPAPRAGARRARGRVPRLPGRALIGGYFGKAGGGSRPVSDSRKATKSSTSRGLSPSGLISFESQGFLLPPRL